MKTIILTDEEYYFLKSLFERIGRQLERKPMKKKWVKQDGLMINLETNEALDIRTNKFVIDVDIVTCALEDMQNNDSAPKLEDLGKALVDASATDNDSNLRAPSGSNANNTIPSLPEIQSAPDWSAHND